MLKDEDDNSIEETETISPSPLQSQTRGENEQRESSHGHQRGMKRPESRECVSELSETATSVATGVASLIDNVNEGKANDLPSPGRRHETNDRRREINEQRRETNEQLESKEQRRIESEGERIKQTESRENIDVIKLNEGNIPTFPRIQKIDARVKPEVTTTKTTTPTATTPTATAAPKANHPNHKIPLNDNQNSETSKQAKNEFSTQNETIKSKLKGGKFMLIKIYTWR